MTLLLISGAISSCGRMEIDDPKLYSECLLINKTEHFVNIHSYSTDVFYDNCDWSIQPNDSIALGGDGNEDSVPVPTVCDSVSVIFDGKKYLIVKFGEGFLRNDNKERVSHSFVRLRHYITDEMYDSASWLISSDSVIRDIQP